MPRSDIEAAFPALAGKPFGLSPEDFNNNCLGYALGDERNWWEPPHGYGQYWPAGFSNDLSVATVEKIIRLSGFTVEIDPKATPEADAIAIYAIGSDWTHFAKFTNGRWISKLGPSHDVDGVSLEDLCIPDYGEVRKVLVRPKP